MRSASCSGPARRASSASTQARAIVAALPPYVTVVGLFVDPEPQAVRAVLAAVPIDVLQFHGSEPAELCRAFGRRYVKAIPVKDGVDLLESVSPYDDAAGLLFDAFSEGDLPGGTGRAFDWGRLTADVRSASAAAADPFRRTRRRQRRARDPRCDAVGRRRFIRRRGARRERRAAARV